MDKDKAVARAKRQMDYINQHKKENYDRVGVLMPKGTKERIKETGESMNAFVNRLVQAELERMGL